MRLPLIVFLSFFLILLISCTTTQIIPITKSETCEIEKPKINPLQIPSAHFYEEFDFYSGLDLRSTINGCTDIEGVSMKPTLSPGNLICWVKPTKERPPQIGDILFYDALPETPELDRQVHRLIRIDKDKGQVIYITRGDSQTQFDMQNKTIDDIIGIVKWIGFQ